MVSRPPLKTLADEYLALARRYAENATEEGLYRASLLGRRMLEARAVPAEIVQIHLTAVEHLSLEGLPKEGSAESSLHPLLLELMIIYAEAHREVRRMLIELTESHEKLRRAQVELEASQRDLRERTAQLVHTGKMNALGELAAGVAHEINQPLNAMMLTCQDLLRDADKGRLTRGDIVSGLHEVTRELRHISEIVDRMRIFTRKTAGTRSTRLDVNDAVKAVVTLIGHQVALCGVELSTDLREGLEVEGDAVRLQQAVMNLVTNARDAVVRAGRGGRVRVRTGAVTDDRGEWVLLEVSDDGPGVPPETRARIFEPFFSTKGLGEGTGLGLSLTKQIVLEHGGAIDVASAEGSETTFRVHIPAAPSGSRSR